MYQNNNNQINNAPLLEEQPQGIPVYNPQSINDQQMMFQQTQAQPFSSQVVNMPPVMQNHVSPMFIGSNLPAQTSTHVVRCLPPIKRDYSDGEYAYVQCPNITTMWIGNTGFSYLTKYCNDHNYYFLSLTEGGFNINGWNETLTKNKINRERLSRFIHEVNTEGRVIENIQNGKSSARQLCMCLGICGVSLLAAFGVVLMLWIQYITSSRPNTLVQKLICYLWAFLLVFGIAAIAYMFKTMGKTYRDFSVSKTMIANNNRIEALLGRWNNEYFLPNGLYVMAPRNLAYIHFVLDSSLTFVLENHPYPHDLVKKKK